MLRGTGRGPSAGSNRQPQDHDAHRIVTLQEIPTAATMEAGYVDLRANVTPPDDISLRTYGG